MNEFSVSDYRAMARALQLAHRGRYTAHPNPRVGCVLLNDSGIVGEGFHAAPGEAHAEIDALRMAGERARGATAVVTLEPCAHTGKTGPCTTALIDAGVTRVVAAMIDPFEQVAGKGLAALQSAGIAVQTGLLEAAARALNAGFLSRVERGRPRTRLKIAASLDGATAMRSGESRWITSDAARRDVQRWRAASGAVLTGSGTVLDDDPSLTVRDAALGGRQPLRAVLDSRLQTPASARLLCDGGETLLFCIDDGRRAALEAAGATVIRIAERDGHADPLAALEALAERGVNDVLVEAGPRLAGSLLAAGLVDELVIYQASHIMGSETRPLVSTPQWQSLSDRLCVDIIERRRVGPDTRIVAVPASRRT